MERKIVYFESGEPGHENTEETLRLATEEARQRGIKKIVLASTTGETARLAAARLTGTDIRLVVVPHQYGFTQSQRFPSELVTELERQGHQVHFGTMLLSAVKWICRFMYSVMCRSRERIAYAMASPPSGFTWSFSR